MTESEKVTLTTALVDNDIEATPEIVAVYLSVAKDAILKRRYPFGGCECCFVPAEYEVLQCQLAARYFLRRGGEGEVAHSENGINRTYGSVNDSDLLQEIVPFAKVGG